MAVTRLLDLDAATYEPHPAHGADRAWQETSCYVDIWIEVLHALGLEPAPLFAFALSSDFDGDQWRFLKIEAEDLRNIYGIQVAEMNPWRTLEHHITEQLSMQHLMTIEIDAYHLPDTAGTSYGADHVKTSIVPNLIDPEAHRLGYFHGPGYFELSGDDYDGALRLHDKDPWHLPPYTEIVRLDRMVRPDSAELLARTQALVASHVSRRPSVNPVSAMRKRLEGDLEWLKAEGLEMFHGYAFTTLRQCGSAAELAASLAHFLAEQGQAVGESERRFTELALTAKTVQFKLARLIAGRNTDLSDLLDAMEGHWDAAMAPVVEHHDG